MRADIVIIGSGSLAVRVANTLSQLSVGSLRVAIIGRSLVKFSNIAAIANARASILGGATTFVPLEMAKFTAAAFSRVFAALKPKVILHAASVQSPWEADQKESAWTKLIASAGFGITLPLQLHLVAEVSRAAADTEAAIVNASYPDCVNVVLDRLGLRHREFRHCRGFLSRPCESTKRGRSRGGPSWPTRCLVEGKGHSQPDTCLGEEPGNRISAVQSQGCAHR